MAPHVVQLLPLLDYGGVETLRVSFARQLRSEAGTRDFDVSFMALGHGGIAARTLHDLGFRVETLDAWAHPLHPLTLWRLHHRLRGLKPQILHAAAIDANVQAAIAAHITGVALVTEEIGIPRTRPAWGRWASGAAHRSADAVIAASESIGRYLVAREAVPQDRIQVIYNCAEVEPVEPDARDAARHELDLVDHHIVIGSVGRLVPEKAYDVLMRSFGSLARSDQRLHLVIAGDGPESARLAQIAERIGVSSRTHLLGKRTDIARILRSFDVFVLPSRSEGLGIALIEAMLAGLPTVSAASDGIVEVIRHEDEGILVPPDDVEALSSAIASLLRDPAAARAMGQHGSAVAMSRFAPSRYTRDLMNLYGTLL